MSKNKIIGFFGLIAVVNLSACGSGAVKYLPPNQGTPAPVTGIVQQAKQQGMMPSFFPTYPSYINNSIYSTQNVQSTTPPAPVPPVGISGAWERANTACDNGVNTSQSYVDISFAFNTTSGNSYAIIEYTPNTTSQFAGAILTVPLDIAFPSASAISGTAIVKPVFSGVICRDQTYGQTCRLFTASALPLMPNVITYGLTNGVLTLSLDSDAMCSTNGQNTPSTEGPIGLRSSTADFSKIN